MTARRLLIAFACVVGLYTMRCVVLPRLLPAGTVEYQGQQIRLSKWYSDYDDYKNDPSNIDPSELPRVQQLVRFTRVDRGCRPWEAASAAVHAVRFPGYGSGSMRSDWSHIRGFTIEVPQADEERVFVLRRQGDLWCVADDFLLRGTTLPMELLEQDGSLVFKDLQGRVVAERPVGAGS